MIIEVIDIEQVEGRSAHILFQNEIGNGKAIIDDEDTNLIKKDRLLFVDVEFDILTPIKLGDNAIYSEFGKFKFFLSKEINELTTFIDGQDFDGMLYLAIGATDTILAESFEEEILDSKRYLTLQIKVDELKITLI